MSSQVVDTDLIQDMGELLESVKPMKPLRRGDIVEGVIMRADNEGLLVHIGHKAEGVVPSHEMRSLDSEELARLEVGDEVIALVVRPETGEGGAILSIDRAAGERGWRDLEKIMESGDQIEGTIVGFNRGGAIVEVEGIHGFVPMSQLVSVSRDNFREAQEAVGEEVKDATEAQEAVGEEVKDATEAQGAVGEEVKDATEAQEAVGEEVKDATEAQEAAGEEVKDATEEVKDATEAQVGDGAANGGVEDPLSEDVGKILNLKVLEVNRGRNRVIFSEREAIRDVREAEKARLIEELQEGEVRRGRVTGISSFGAFVDLGGADGLVHISELSWNPVNTPEDVVKVGDEVDVYILRVDAENKKIALSLRRLQPEPWETIEERYTVDDIVDATVTKLTNFGAFARIEGSEGAVEGLIHISELANRKINHPREVVSEGDSVKLKILRIEPERRRMGLSLRQAEEEYYE